MRAIPKSAAVLACAHEPIRLPGDEALVRQCISWLGARSQSRIAGITKALAVA